MVFQIGQIPQLQVQWTDINSNPADPSAITIEIQAPDGTQTTYSYATGQIIRTGVGAYYYDLSVTEAGQYLYLWTATGTIAGAQQGSITVAESILVPPTTPSIDLCTIDEVRYWLNQPSTAPTDAGLNLKLERLITSASRMILTLTNRDSFTTAQTYSERRNGNGASLMATYQWPILSVTSVTFAPSMTIPMSPDGFQAGWVNDLFSVMLVGAYWFPRGYQNITLNYSAGYNSVPQDINQACVELVCQKFKRSTHIDQTSQHLGDQTVAFDRRDIPVEVQTVVDKYSRRAIIE
jgi:hypothetical protein